MENLFPNLATLSVGEWFAIVMTTWFLLAYINHMRKPVLTEVKHTVKTDKMVDAVVERMLERLPAKIDEDQERKLNGLRQEVARLREEREWVLIGLELHGLKLSTYGGGPAFAPALLNTRTGAVKAAPKEFRFYTNTEHYWSSMTNRAPRAGLFGPRWQSVTGEPNKIFFLDVAYELR